MALNDPSNCQVRVMPINLRGNCYYCCFRFSWAITPQWKGFYIVSPTLSSFSRNRAISTRTSSHVCFLIFLRFFHWYFSNFLFNMFIWNISFSTAAKSAEKLTPELVIFSHLLRVLVIISGNILLKMCPNLLCTVSDSHILCGFQTRSPSKAASMFSGTQEKCATCGKTAYPLEKVWILFLQDFSLLQWCV